MKSPCYLVTLSLESSDFQTFLKQYVILVPFGALILSFPILHVNIKKIGLEFSEELLKLEC